MDGSEDIFVINWLPAFVPERLVGLVDRTSTVVSVTSFGDGDSGGPSGMSTLRWRKEEEDHDNLSALGISSIGRPFISPLAPEGNTLQRQFGMLYARPMHQRATE
jgi:hypothetical protein